MTEQPLYEGRQQRSTDSKSESDAYLHRVIGVRTISPTRAGQLLGCSRATVIRMIEDGTVKAYRLRTRGWIHVDYDSFCELIRKSKSEPAI
jgi:excisionase family DNA binding protein